MVNTPTALQPWYFSGENLRNPVGVRFDCNLITGILVSFYSRGDCLSVWFKASKATFWGEWWQKHFFISNKVGMYTKIYQDGFTQDFSKTMFFRHIFYWRNDDRHEILMRFSSRLRHRWLAGFPWAMKIPCTRLLLIAWPSRNSWFTHEKRWFSI